MKTKEYKEYLAWEADRQTNVDEMIAKARSHIKPLKDVNLSMAEYDAYCSKMEFKYKRGLISDEEYKKFMLSEDTLWNIMQNESPKPIN